jgi:hypothetical protein
MKLFVDHPDETTGRELIMDALGSADPVFLNGLFPQIHIASGGDFAFDQRRMDFMLSVIKGIKPRNQLEAMLAAQMAAVHMAVMAFAGQVIPMQYPPQQDFRTRALYNLARTFAAQMDALWRYRASAEQSASKNAVNDGNQAVGGHPAPAPDEVAPAPTVASQPAAADLQQQPAKPTADQPAAMVVQLRRKRKA